MKTVIAERVRHDSGMRVTLRFPDDKELIKIAKSLPDAGSVKKCNAGTFLTTEML